MQVLRAFRSDRHCSYCRITGTAGSVGTSGPGMSQVLGVHRDPRGQKHYPARPVLSGRKPLSRPGCKTADRQSWNLGSRRSAWDARTVLPMSWGQDGLIGRTQLGLGAPQTSAGLAQRAGEHDSRGRKAGLFGIWRYSQEVRKAESELKVQGQDLLASQGHQASRETCEDRGGERYTEAQPRDPAGPPVASVVLTDRAESPERSSQGRSRGLAGEPGLDLPSQDELGSISITGSRPTAGQGAWELHATGHLHQGSDSAARAVRTSSRQISSALDSTGSRASQHSRPLHQDPGVWDTEWLCSPPWRLVGSLLGHLVTS